MSGLLKPYAAKKLVSALKQEVGLPIHLHTHDTTGNQVAAYLMAAEAGVDIVDCAIASLSSAHQPALPERRGGRPPGPGAGHRPGSAASSRGWTTTGRTCACATPALTTGLQEPHHRHLPLRDPRRPVHQPEAPGGVPGPGPPVRGGQGDVQDRQRDAGRHRKGDALLQDGGRPGHLHGAERPDPGEHRGAGQRAFSFPDSVVQLLQGHDGPAGLGLPAGGPPGGGPQGRGSPSPAVPASCCPPWTSTRCEAEMEKFMDDDPINMRAMLSYCLYPQGV